MRLSARFVSPAIRTILGWICNIDASAIAKIQLRGPLIIITNHINFLEVPLIQSYLYPRDIVGIVKKETWDNLFIGSLANIWGAISIDRNATDTKALRLALEALKQRKIIAMAPEGTRSGNGRLQKGHGGVVQLAARSGAPIIPLGHFGQEYFWSNLSKPRRTRVVFRVGEPFRLRLPEGGLTKSIREESTDEIMRRLASILPEKYRGYYSEGLQTPEKWIETI